jgi:hypothetical protein
MNQPGISPREMGGRAGFPVAAQQLHHYAGPVILAGFGRDEGVHPGFQPAINMRDRSLRNEAPADGAVEAGLALEARDDFRALVRRHRADAVALVPEGIMARPEIPAVDGQRSAQHIDFEVRIRLDPRHAPLGWQVDHAGQCSAGIVMTKRLQP